MIYGLRLDELLRRGTSALEAHGAESRVEPRRRFNIPAVRIFSARRLSMPESDSKGRFT